MYQVDGMWGVCSERQWEAIKRETTGPACQGTYECYGGICFETGE